MRTILLIGAGRSASTLIKYLLDNSSTENWKVSVADISLELAKQKIANHPNAQPIAFDVNNEQQRSSEIAKADIVVSMLPAAMHFEVAKECLKEKKHMVTASYVSKQMSELDTATKQAGVLFLNEMGLDPGIDHLSAMKVIDEIKAGGGKIITFKSYCGGLVAPEFNDNPWGYKFTWNPYAVVTAGQGGGATSSVAQYLHHGKIKYIPYSRLFLTTEKICVDGWGNFESYANRDSLTYLELYGLHDAENMLRGTLRMPGYCRAWNAFVQMGLTDTYCKVTDSDKLTYAELVENFLPEGEGNIKKRVAKLLSERIDSQVMKKLDWLGILKSTKIGLKESPPAEILLHLLLDKWKLKPKDKDMVVMQHIFEYTLPNKKSKKQKRISSMVVIGKDQTHTAMAKTVGLPLGIAAKLILNKKIELSGVRIPIAQEIYNPVLSELEQFGIKFKETHK